MSLLAAEKIAQIYHDVHGIPTTLFRLTNIYGPRAQMQHSRFGVANWFIRLAIDGETIKVFGDGHDQRDFVYIDDCVAAILAGHQSPGGGRPGAQRRRRPAVVVPRARRDAWCASPAAAPGSSPRSPPSAPRRSRATSTPTSAVSARSTGWSPRTSLDEGLRASLDYYRRHRTEYWADDAA